jgi:hypothetical protein
MDWVTLVSACGLAAVIGVGFVLWERYENDRLARNRLHSRVPRRLSRHRPRPIGITRRAA